MKRKKSMKTRLKNEAWALLSQYVRRKAASPSGLCACVTCGTKKHWKKLHAGHFVDGRNNTVLLDERLIHPQCFRCNFKRKNCLAGNKIKYVVFMMKTYGLTIDEINGLDDLRFVKRDMTEAEYLELIAKYQDALVGLDIRDERLAHERIANGKDYSIGDR